MITSRVKTILSLTLIAIPPMLANAPGAWGAAPVKLILAGHFGREVNLTEVNANGGSLLEDLCSVESKDECQAGTASSIAGGFDYPEGIAGAPNGNVYVVDQNNRVQELTATGEFVLMFGKKVDKTTGANICTKASGDTCGAGEPGGAAEAFDGPQSVAVDPDTGNVYVLDFTNWRVDEYTAGGEFVLMFGKGVNKKGGNICTKAEASECQAGVRSAPESTEHAAFNFDQLQGDLLAVGGGPEHLLYVGDEHRVQEFNEKGEWKGEIQLPAAVTFLGASITAIAVDAATEAVYIVYNHEPIVREYNRQGEELKHIEVPPRESGRRVYIFAIALDPSGHFAVWAHEEVAVDVGGETEQFGALYEAGNGRLLTRFETPQLLYSSSGFQGVSGLGFNGEGELHATLPGLEEVWSYTPKSVAELVTESASCVPGSESESDVTFDCALNGKLDPWGVAGTEAWFQWGRSPALGRETTPQPVENAKRPPVEGEEEPPVGVSAVVPGVRPNETGFYYRLAGRDRNVVAPEQLNGEPLSFTTPLAAPRVVGEPSAPFVRSSSVVMHGELNPENAETRYFFEYAPGVLSERCPHGVSAERAHCEGEGVAATSIVRSGVYGKIGATLEATGLQPAASYHYRLTADNEREAAGKTEGATTLGPEAAFTTAPAPAPAAVTGMPSAVGTTGGTVSGTVDPDGQSATYAFELGVYNGAGTYYGVVFSGSAGSGVVPVTESLDLTGLQSGTTYAYRITVKSGYGTATGGPVTFTTSGLPEVLVSPVPLAMLAIPPIVLPAEAKAIPSKSRPKKKPKKGKLKKRKRRPGRKTGVMKAKK